MTEPPFNPYEPPLTHSKLSAADASEIQHRDLAMFVLLMVVTLGMYAFYIVYEWARELNGLQGRVKYPPLVVLLVNLLSCGLAGIVFECLYAFDVAEATRTRSVVDRSENLATWVLVCNCLAMVLSLTVIGIVLAMPIGILASALVQAELNKLAARNAGTH